MKRLIDHKELIIAVIALLGITAHLVMRFVADLDASAHQIPLYATLLLGGVPLVLELFIKLLRRELGSDLLAGISIVTSILLGEYLAGAFVVLMLSGGETLEAYAASRASSVLKALAGRSPTLARRRTGEGDAFEEIPIADIAIGDELVVLPHDLCPVDGVVIEGHGVMDESYLTGEPYEISKAPGAPVLSGSVNGERVLVIRATRLAEDSRFARIMAVVEDSAQKRPRIRRLGDKLGAIYTPIALAIGLLAYALSGDPVRFLAVLVIATPCPLLIGIPTALMGAISLAAKRGIVIRDPAVLEEVEQCTTFIFDKTGTLTYGEPRLTEIVPAPGFERHDVLTLAASLERYSKHPLAHAVVAAAEEEGVVTHAPENVEEPPGTGMRGLVKGRQVELTGRALLTRKNHPVVDQLPPQEGGLECIVLVDGALAGTCRFRDEPREGTRPFIEHLSSHHGFTRVMLVSGDRDAEVRYLAEQVGITEVRSEQQPEDKVNIVREETARAQTMFIGDGINDAPALLTAHVGVAMGQHSDVTMEAAGAVIMDRSIRRIDEFLHIGARFRRIALESAVGGMVLSVIGMGVAAFGYLPPVAGAIGQELIDVLAVVNALRAAFPSAHLTDY